MFAARANQENAIYEQQTAAAAKPLNQGVKGLAPKTPGKTPFKVALNDENARLGLGKTGGKGKDGLFGDGKVDRSAFVTPAGPRNRAPLGNKTTNAKAVQTPAPPTQGKQSAKHTSPRMRRAKVKIHEAEPDVAQTEAEERDIEYMPPREVPLPDHPDDWPIDRTYPQFEGKNLTRGWYSEFAAQKDDDEDEFSDFEEKLQRIEELNQKKKQAQLAKKMSAIKPAPLQKAVRDPLASKSASSLTDRSAASALAKKSTQLGFAAPTAATKAKVPTSVLFARKAVVPFASCNPRHTAAKVASNSTLGYSKGRSVSASKRSPLAGVYEQHPSSAQVETTSPQKTSLHELFGRDLTIEDADADLGFGEAGLEALDEEDTAETFQLDTTGL